MVRTVKSEKRGQFLTSALKLFVKNGVMNTSTAAIAKEAGTAAGTLFLYFPTKQQLLDELILEIGREQSGRVKKAMKPSHSAREAFFTIWNTTIHWFLENMDAYAYLQQVRDTGMISESAVQKSGEFFGYYFEAIQRGLAEGSLKNYPFDLIGEFLYRDIVAVMNLLIRQSDSNKHEEIIQQGFDVYWDGIKSS
jgi:AcrR family transcriptional regulator